MVKLSPEEKQQLAERWKHPLVEHEREKLEASEEEEGGRPVYKKAKLTYQPIEERKQSSGYGANDVGALISGTATAVEPPPTNADEKRTVRNRAAFKPVRNRAALKPVRNRAALKPTGVETLLRDSTTAIKPSPTNVDEKRPVRNHAVLKPPKEELTGVNESIVVACANLSQQIYGVDSKNAFDLSTDALCVEVIDFDRHDDLDPAIPAFVVATTDEAAGDDTPVGKAMILGWRGTQNPLDWISDFSLAPVLSPSWGEEVASGIRAHGTYCSFVSSDLAVHEEKIIAEIKKRDIKTILFTGHSLGGGLAQIAHLYVLTQMKRKESPWSTLDDIKCHTVVFAAPMVILDVDEVDESNSAAKELIEELGKSSCNFVFGCDVVPRAFAYLHFVHDALKSATTETLASNLPFGWGSRSLTEWGINKLQATIATLLPVATKFRHVGHILHYETAQAQPVKLVDGGPDIGKKLGKEYFSSYEYSQYIGNKREYEHVKELRDAHSFFPKHFAEKISSESKV